MLTELITHRFQTALNKVTKTNKVTLRSDIFAIYLYFRKRFKPFFTVLCNGNAEPVGDWMVWIVDHSSIKRGITVNNTLVSYLIRLRGSEINEFLDFRNLGVLKCLSTKRRQRGGFVRLL